MPDSNGIMTPDELKIAAAWLDQKVVNPQFCTSCNQPARKLDTQIHLMGKVTGRPPNVVTNPGVGLAVFTMECSNCGSSAFYNAVKAGILG
jgi:hypothetical protein